MNHANANHKKLGQRQNTEAIIKEAMIKEESAKCSCDKCKAIFDKAKSLHIHKGRSHRSQ